MRNVAVGQGLLTDVHTGSLAFEASSDEAVDDTDALDTRYIWYCTYFLLVLTWGRLSISLTVSQSRQHKHQRLYLLQTTG